MFAPSAGGYTGQSSFDAFGPDFTGGARVGSEPGPNPLVYAAAGPGGGPRVRVFAPPSTPTADFFAFDPAFAGGVFVG